MSGIHLLSICHGTNLPKRKFCPPLLDHRNNVGLCEATLMGDVYLWLAEFINAIRDELGDLRGGHDFVLVQLMVKKFTSVSDSFRAKLFRLR
jgi:hypothetical protein